MNADVPAPVPILSRPVAVDGVPDGGLSVSVETTPAEREGLRALNRLVALDALRGDVTLRRAGKHGLLVSGRVEAALNQTCVVTLDPFPAVVDETFEVHFLQPAALERWRKERGESPGDPEEAEDEPDEIVDDHVDLGVLVAEYFTLALDPYPKKPGVRFEDVAPDLSAREDSPFAVLKALHPDGI